jgi:DNA-binding MarR family transcriptional regulator
MAELPLVAGWQRATHHLLSALDEELDELSLTPGEVNALACFAGEEAVPVRELISRTGQKPSTFTGVLDRLERRGLIERRPNPADRRSTVVALTGDGGRAAATVRAAFVEMERRLPPELRGAAASLSAVEPSTLQRPPNSTS